MNHEWADLRDKAEAKREQLNSAHGVQTFHIECRETISWIEDKKRILQSTDSLEMDLTGIMTLQVNKFNYYIKNNTFINFILYYNYLHYLLQRRLSGMERDLAAIQAKLDSLESEAQINEKEHPEEAAVIRERIETIQKDWEELTQMVRK